MLELLFNVLKTIVSPLVPFLREQPKIHVNYTPGPQSNHGVGASQL